MRQSQERRVDPPPGEVWTRLGGFVNSARSRGKTPLSIVVPAFNEAHRIPNTLPRLLELVPEEVELIVVDDGSTDATADLLRTFLRGRPNCAVFNLPENGGKGAAVRAGMLHAQGEVVVFMDADLSADLAALPRLVEALEHADVAIGSRKSPDAEIEKGIGRKVVSAAFAIVTRLMTGLRFGDTQCGFKAFRRDATRLVFSHQQLDGFAFDVEILLLAHRLGLKVAEVPIRWADAEGSTVRWWIDPLKMMRDIVRIKWLTRHVGKEPVGMGITGGPPPPEASLEIARQVAECAS
ncbi:MAG: glycosyl transferase family 2 [Acidimicrobiia bacterium]|nr:glycosyl transferase family 2 [Acidimicrobiia bacterium]